MSTVKHFQKISKEYDRNNNLLSFGICKLWNRALVKATPCEGTLLDLCAGTGTIAFEHLKQGPKKVILLDQCQEMLDVAKERAPNDGCEFICADAASIPLEDESVDVVTTAYGIRNVEDQERCIQEVYRVLKPGGTWGILELTSPKAPTLRFLHRAYLNFGIPFLGRLFSSSKEAYSYLSKSVQAYKLPTRELLDAGFREFKLRPLTFGAATLLIAHK